ncbi:MAG TPA: hypothetical protein VIX38_02105 [Nitrososphaeraceae archaeon]
MRCLNWYDVPVGRAVFPVLRGVGSAVWSTDSTGKLAFLDNILSFFIIEVDEMGNFSSKDRELK